MGSVYKRGGKWYLSYKDHTGKWRQRAGYTHRDNTVRMLARLEKEAALIREGLRSPTADELRAPIGRHVDAYITGIRARNATPKYLDKTRKRLELAFERMGVHRLTDLQLDKVSDYLAGMLEGRDGARYSAKTRDDVASLLRSFGEWCVNTERIPRNPLRTLTRIGKQTDQTFRRLALRGDQFEDLVEAATVRPVQNYRTAHPTAKAETLQRYERIGRDRARFYLYARFTGPRTHRDARTVRWRDHDLDAELPLVTFPDPKNRTRMPVPLHPCVVAVLKQIRQERELELGRPVRPDERVFHVPRHILEQLRKDADFAGIPHSDYDRLDMHAFRTTLQTELERQGVPERCIDLVLRHKVGGGVGRRHYSRPDLADAYAAGILQLPIPERALTACGVDFDAAACSKCAANPRQPVATRGTSSQVPEGVGSNPSDDQNRTSAMGGNARQAEAG